MGHVMPYWLVSSFVSVCELCSTCFFVVPGGIFYLCNLFFAPLLCPVGVLLLFVTLCFATLIMRSSGQQSPTIVALKEIDSIQSLSFLVGTLHISFEVVLLMLNGS